MFGYIAINKAEMKFRDFDIYHAYYCGLCKDLKERYGRSGQITLSYDMTFLIILQSGLYEPPTGDSVRNCVALIINVWTTGQTNIRKKPGSIPGFFVPR